LAIGLFFEKVFFVLFFLFLWVSCALYFFLFYLVPFFCVRFKFFFD